jgi:hypothetical protein
MNLDWKIVCFDTQHILIILGLIENKDLQSCHASRHNTRAGFESAPLVSVEKGSSSISRYGRPLNAVGAAHTEHPGHLST